MLTRPEQYVQEVVRALRAASRGMKFARCCFCGQILSPKFEEYLEIGFLEKDRPKKRVFWHIDCYCKNNNITRQHYFELERKEFE